MQAVTFFDSKKLRGGLDWALNKAIGTVFLNQHTRPAPRLSGFE